MTTGVLEINDAGLRLTSLEGGPEALVDSPGIAVMTGEGLLLGQDARRRLRLQPRVSSSHFWQRLGTEPLPWSSSQYRHHADLAYAQLLSVSESAGCEELILAVPGSFTREQLSLLLGIAEHCSFTAVGLVDSAVAAAAAGAGAPPLLHVDIQLHQGVVTRLEGEGELRRGGLEILAQRGLLNLEDRWARTIAELFVDQCRFDPFHSAATEQQLYDYLPACLDPEGGGEQVLEIEGRHVKLSRGQLIEAALPEYRQLAGYLQDLVNPGDGIVLSHRLAHLPGLADQFRATFGEDLQILPTDTPARGVADNLDRIRGKPGELPFVQALPATAPARSATAASAAAPKTANSRPGLLLGQRVWPVDGDGLHLHLEIGPSETHAAHCRVLSHDRQLVLHPAPGQSLQVNGENAADGRTLKPGDCVTATEARGELRVIEILE